MKESTSHETRKKKCKQPYRGFSLQIKWHHLYFLATILTFRVSRNFALSLQTIHGYMLCGLNWEMANKVYNNVKFFTTKIFTMLYLSSQKHTVSAVLQFHSSADCRNPIRYHALNRMPRIRINFPSDAYISKAGFPPGEFVRATLSEHKNSAT